MGFTAWLFNSDTGKLKKLPGKGRQWMHGKWLALPLPTEWPALVCRTSKVSRCQNAQLYQPTLRWRLRQIASLNQLLCRSLQLNCTGNRHGIDVGMRNRHPSRAAPTRNVNGKLLRRAARPVQGLYFLGFRVVEQTECVAFSVTR